MRRLFICFVVVAGVAPDAVLAEGSAVQGHEMAVRLCSRCHAISGEGPSPVAAAPAFAALGRLYPVDYLAEALAEGIVTGHGPIMMPEFVFEPEEIDDLIAYLESVQE
ncbi:MAG: cytochrome c [Rhodospirillales bacterium]|nr:cytochrome c [Rhodospirillales bacterium]